MPKRIEIDPGELASKLQENPGITQQELADYFDCGTTTINRRLRKYGLSTKTANERRELTITRSELQEKFQMFPEISYHQLAEMFECSVQTIANRCSDYELSSVYCGGDNPFAEWHKVNPDFGENQRGEANPVHKVKHLYDDPEYVERITRGIRAHVDEKRGSTYEDVYGEEKTLEYKQKLREASPRRIAKIRKKETEPEQILSCILQDLELPFKSQAVVGYYTVDFLVGERLVVQADGDFWHANPDIYTEDLYPLQEKNRRIDASCNSYLENRGFNVLRFWESDLKQNPGECAEVILEQME